MFVQVDRRVACQVVGRIIILSYALRLGIYVLPLHIIANDRKYKLQAENYVHDIHVVVRLPVHLLRKEVPPIGYTNNLLTRRINLSKISSSGHH